MKSELSVPQRECEIPVEMKCLFDNLDKLQNSLDHLIVRLSPVLREENRVNEKKEEIEKILYSQYGRELKEVNTRLINISDLINYTSNLLEI
jgi:hypothetical protein